MTEYFAGIDKIRYAGPQSREPLAFKWYDKDRLVLGKRMEEHLRFAVCYWHSFCWNGFDPFGYDGTFERPWQHMADPMAAARSLLGQFGRADVLAHAEVAEKAEPRVLAGLLEL